MRSIAAGVLALPLYWTVGFGWEFIPIVGLQILAGLDFNMFRKEL